MSGKWAFEAACIFSELTGGVVEPGYVGRKLKRLVDLHGWVNVKPAWQRYLTEQDPEFQGIDHFARSYPRWADVQTNGRVTQERAREMFKAAGLMPPWKMPDYYTSPAAVQKHIETEQQKRKAS